MERKFGPYTLIHQIAVGGMAEIHLARTEGIAGFEKYVAIKMIHPNFSEDEQFVQPRASADEPSAQPASSSNNPSMKPRSLTHPW